MSQLARQDGREQDNGRALSHVSAVHFFLFPSLCGGVQSRDATEGHDKNRNREEKAGEVVLAAARGGDAGEPWRNVLCECVANMVWQVMAQHAEVGEVLRGRKRKCAA